MVGRSLPKGCIALLSLVLMLQPAWAVGEFVSSRGPSSASRPTTTEQPDPGIHPIKERLGRAVVSVMSYPNHPEARLVLTILSSVLNNPTQQVDPKLFQPFVPTATLAELFFFTGMTKDPAYIGVMMKRAPTMGTSSYDGAPRTPEEQQRQLACYQALMRYVNSSNVEDLRSLKTVPGRFTLTELLMLAGFFAKAGPADDADFWTTRLEQRAAQIPHEMGEPPAKTSPVVPKAFTGNPSLYGGGLVSRPAPAPPQTLTQPDDNTQPETVANQDRSTSQSTEEDETPQALVVPEELLKDLEQRSPRTGTAEAGPSDVQPSAVVPQGKPKTAQEALKQGLGYLTGHHGVTKNPTLAFQHFQQAAAMGSGAGYMLMAVCYDEGIGTQQNASLAFRHYQEAERRGEKLPELFFNLANMAAQGRGTQKNLPLAKTYYQKAITMRPTYTKALFNLALLEHLDQNYSAAFQHYLQGAKLGHTASAVNLATLYANGQGIPQNMVRAYFWSGVGTRSRDPKVSALAQQKLQTYRPHLSPQQLASLDQLLKQPRSYKSF